MVLRLYGIKTKSKYVRNLQGFFLIRWSVENRSPIVFVRIFFLYLLLFFIFIYFSPLFCSEDNSRSVQSKSFNFNTVIGHCHKTWQEHFQGHQVFMTSSRRHFVFLLVLSTHDHIFITERHFLFIFIMIKFNIRPVNFRSKNARACVRPRVSARAKFQNALNRLKLILHTFQAILSILQKNAHTSMRARFRAYWYFPT